MSDLQTPVGYIIIMLMFPKELVNSTHLSIICPPDLFHHSEWHQALSYSSKIAQVNPSFILSVITNKNIAAGAVYHQNKLQTDPLPSIFTTPVQPTHSL